MFVICVIISGFLQATVLRDLNLLVVLAVFAGLRKGPVAGLVAGAAIGTFASILSISSLGLNLGLYGLVGFLTGIVRSHIFYKEDILMEFVFSFCGMILFYFAYFILTKAMYPYIFSTALFSAIVSPLVFRVVER